VNTIRGLSVDRDTLRPTLALGPGGYSGPGLLPIAAACVYACARAVELPIVGMGGVASGRDALALVAAGASAVALGTVLFADPSAPDRVRGELEAEAGARGYESAAAMRAVAHEVAPPLRA
jgi:dihydroorotate dehydrogenase (NAD+) catalytic subunit